MARFRFELEPLLTVRKNAERECQRTVAMLERERRELEDRVRRQQNFITTGKHDLRDRLVGAIDVIALRAHAVQAMHSVRAAQQLVLELAGIHRRLESARAALTAAARERRAIELLRERRFEAWRKKLDRAEDARIDELATIAAARDRGEMENA